MAPRTPVDLDNPSWADWFRGSTKYGNRLASDWTGGRNKVGDQYKPREAFVDAARQTMGPVEAFNFGLRSVADRGGLGGRGAVLMTPSDVPSGEATKKMEYAAGQLQPVPYMLGEMVATPYAVADSIVSGKVLGAVLDKVAAPLKGAGGWLANSRAGQATTAAAKEFATKRPFATKLGLGSAAATAGMLGATMADNYFRGTGDKFEQARQERAAQEAAAAQTADAPPQKQPDWYDQMAGIAGVDRSIIEGMVQRDGGVTLETLQTLGGMKPRAPTYRDIAMQNLDIALRSELAAAEATKDPEVIAKAQERATSIIAQILGVDDFGSLVTDGLK